jgi:hypothetical protein
VIPGVSEVSLDIGLLKAAALAYTYSRRYTRMTFRLWNREAR